MKADKQTEEEIKETRRFFQPGRIKRLKVWTRTRQAACRTIARYTRGGIAAGRKQPDEGKDDDNRDMETAFGENNNRESTPGTRPKGKNVGRVARRARKQLFFSPGLRRCCSLPSSTCTRSTARWTALSFSLSFRSYFFLSFFLSFLFAFFSLSLRHESRDIEAGKREGGRFRCESGDPTSSRIDELRKYRRLICVSLHAAVELDTSHEKGTFLPEAADSMAFFSSNWNGLLW